MTYVRHHNVWHLLWAIVVFSGMGGTLAMLFFIEWGCGPDLEFHVVEIHSFSFLKYISCWAPLLRGPSKTHTKGENDWYWEEEMQGFWFQVIRSWQFVKHPTVKTKDGSTHRLCHRYVQFAVNYFLFCGVLWNSTFVRFLVKVCGKTENDTTSLVCYGSTGMFIISPWGKIHRIHNSWKKVSR